MMEGNFEEELMAFAYQDKENPDQKEVDLYFTIGEFTKFVNEKGVDKVIEELPPEIEEKLYWHYYSVLYKNKLDNDY